MSLNRDLKESDSRNQLKKSNSNKKIERRNDNGNVPLMSQQRDSQVSEKSLKLTKKSGKSKNEGATLDQFKMISSLGDGAYSKVYKVKRVADAQMYALKMVQLKNLSDKEKENAINEVRILASIKHPNIISYKEAFADKQSESLCIVMELVDMGDLYGQIMKNLKRQGSSIPQPDLDYEGLSEEFVWKVFIQVLKGLKSMHDLNIMHRDLKSANVFLNSDDTVKLGDMNVSKVASQEGLNFTQTGTPYYASPEVWKDEPYNIKSDIWSLGCVLYEMITLKPPFQSSSMKGLFKRVCSGKIQRIPKNYSQDLWTIVKQMLQVNSKYRPDCNKLLGSSILQNKEKQFLQQKNAYHGQSKTQSDLLKTIIFPKSLNQMKSRLPEPRYQDYNQTQNQLSTIEKHEKQSDSQNTKDTGSVTPNLVRRNKNKNQSYESKRETATKKKSTVSSPVSKNRKSRNPSELGHKSGKSITLPEKQSETQNASTIENSPSAKMKTNTADSKHVQKSPSKVSLQRNLSPNTIKQTDHDKHSSNQVMFKSPKHKQKKSSRYQSPEKINLNQQNQNLSVIGQNKRQQDKQQPLNKQKSLKLKSHRQTSPMDIQTDMSLQQAHLIGNYENVVRKNNEYHKKMMQKQKPYQAQLINQYNNQKYKNSNSQVNLRSYENNNKLPSVQLGINKSVSYLDKLGTPASKEFLSHQDRIRRVVEKQNNGYMNQYNQMQGNPYMPSDYHQNRQKQNLNKRYYINQSMSKIPQLPSNLVPQQGYKHNLRVNQSLDNTDTLHSSLDHNIPFQSHQNVISAYRQSESLQPRIVTNNKKQISLYNTDVKKSINNHRRQKMKENINQISEIYSLKNQNNSINKPQLESLDDIQLPQLPGIKSTQAIKMQSMKKQNPKKNYNSRNDRNTRNLSSNDQGTYNSKTLITQSNQGKDDLKRSLEFVNTSDGDTMD